MHADFLQKLELYVARFISKHLGGTLGFLLHEVYLKKGTLLERQISFWMQSFLQRLEIEIARFISKKLDGTLDSLLHEVYLENTHYWKGKWIFACSLFAEIGALICKVYKQAIGRNTWLSFASCLPRKCTLLERQMNFCMQNLLQQLEL